jgi:myosin heavy subunit
METRALEDKTNHALELQKQRLVLEKEARILKEKEKKDLEKEKLENQLKERNDELARLKKEYLRLQMRTKKLKETTVSIQREPAGADSTGKSARRPMTPQVVPALPSRDSTPKSKVIEGHLKREDANSNTDIEKEGVKLDSNVPNAPVDEQSRVKQAELPAPMEHHAVDVNTKAESIPVSVVPKSIDSKAMTALETTRKHLAMIQSMKRQLQSGALNPTEFALGMDSISKELYLTKLKRQAQLQPKEERSEGVQTSLVDIFRKWIDKEEAATMTEVIITKDTESSVHQPNFIVPSIPIVYDKAPDSTPDSNQNVVNPSVAVAMDSIPLSINEMLNELGRLSASEQFHAPSPGRVESVPLSINEMLTSIPEPVTKLRDEVSAVDTEILNSFVPTEKLAIPPDQTEIKESVASRTTSSQANAQCIKSEEDIARVELIPSPPEPLSAPILIDKFFGIKGVEKTKDDSSVDPIAPAPQTKGDDATNASEAIQNLIPERDSNEGLPIHKKEVALEEKQTTSFPQDVPVSHELKSEDKPVSPVLTIEPVAKPTPRLPEVDILLTPEVAASSVEAALNERGELHKSEAKTVSQSNHHKQLPFSINVQDFDTPDEVTDSESSELPTDPIFNEPQEPSNEPYVPRYTRKAIMVKKVGPADLGKLLDLNLCDLELKTEAIAQIEAMRANRTEALLKQQKELITSRYQMEKKRVEEELERARANRVDSSIQTMQTPSVAPVEHRVRTKLEPQDELEERLQMPLQETRYPAVETVTHPTLSQRFELENLALQNSIRSIERETMPAMQAHSAVRTLDPTYLSSQIGVPSRIRDLLAESKDTELAVSSVSEFSVDDLSLTDSINPFSEKLPDSQIMELQNLELQKTIRIMERDYPQGAHTIVEVPPVKSVSPARGLESIQQDPLEAYSMITIGLKWIPLVPCRQ